MPELISPAGNLEKLKTAFAYGADAVYLGVPDFSLRARLNEFRPALIKFACQYARKQGKKVYATVNIFAHNRHLKRLPTHIKQLREARVDAVIVSDPGIIRVIKKYWPQAKLHLSTQANCLNAEAAKFWAKYVKRIILARETSLAEIREIHRAVPKLELEYFVHGAMCMAYSGRCLLSKFFVDRSANLGDCVQPCRWPYKLKIIDNNQEKELSDLRILITASGHQAQSLEVGQDAQGTYLLNSHDLCLLPYLKELAQAGIKAFKIEGRTKSVYYVATVTGAYRQAIEIIKKNQRTKTQLNNLAQDLKDKLYHRGYTTGFLFGKGGGAQLTTQAAKQASWEFCGQVIKTKTKGSAHFLFVKVHNTLLVGQTIEIVRPYYDIIKLKLEKMVDNSSGEQITEAHGGRGQVVVIEVKQKIPIFSILRRPID